MPAEVRRFPLPWRIVATDACFWIEDAEGKRVAYVYFDERPWGVSGDSYRRLTRAEALRIARNIAKLPEILRR
jgi:hypothetical protein